MKSTAPIKLPIQALARLLAMGALLCALVHGSRASSDKGASAEASMVRIPAGSFSPLLQTVGEKAEQVPAFLIDVNPVTNAQFLAFVKEHPKWQRSRVSRLFADSTYLQHWAGDIELGAGAPAEAPVANVSWFAARAYAASLGKRLPSTSEWERAASSGYHDRDARKDTAMLRDIYEWLARPTPAVLPSVADAHANLFGVRALFGYVWEWVEDFNTSMVTGESRADGSIDRNLFCGSGSVGTRDTADYAAFMRLALRSSLKASNTTTSLGFRCAANAPQ